MNEIVRMQSMDNGRGFRAHALRGGEVAAAIDPCLGVDHVWMSAATFPPHPHAGFSAVSYLFLDSETGISNRDSLGARNIIRPGGLHWTAAGRGVVHEEVPAVSGKTVHMLQIFVNLAVERQGADPFVLGIEPEEVPVVELSGGKVRVALGSFGDARSPLHPPTEVSLLEISLDEGGELSVPVPAGYSGFILPIAGRLEIDGQSFDAGKPKAPLYSALDTAREIRMRATQGHATAVLFAGVPLRQPVFWHGPLAAASDEALAARVAAYQRGEFGSL